MTRIDGDRLAVGRRDPFWSLDMCRWSGDEMLSVQLVDEIDTDNESRWGETETSLGQHLNCWRGNEEIRIKNFNTVSIYFWNVQ